VAEDAKEHKTVPSKLLRLRARCPSCGSSPALRVSERAVSDAAKHDPAEALATYQCQRRRCGAIYVLHAGAYQTAS
jgi:phage terminase large subunit GpA-like protein